jgi:pimeloyl-ACP methyl ester carboxylesterase
MREEAFLFGDARSLVGVVTDPTDGEARGRLPAVILLNSGIVHRVGLNRLHVKVARKLAAEGFVVMRFDFSGIGDSGAREDGLPFQKSAISETREAMTYLGATRGVERFIVIGICSGAAMSLKTALADPRVVGAVSVNNHAYLQGLDERSSAALKNRARARHYWRIAFSSSFSAQRWLKAITGKVKYRRLVGVLSLRWRDLFVRNGKKVSAASGLLTDLRLLAGRGVCVLLVHSEGDESLDHLTTILGNEGREKSASGLFQLEIIPGANHNLTLLWSQKALLKLIQDWTRVMAQEKGRQQ